ncbi:N-acetylmuramoyl-L-alanine amidase [Corynebacterium sp. 335C]
MATTRRRINGTSFNRRNFLMGTAAAVAATPLVALGGGAAYRLIDDNPAGPLQPLVDKLPLIEGATVAVDDAAIAMAELSSEANPQRGLVKELRQETEFSMFALTWPGFADVTAYFRAERPDGSWSEWYHAETDNADAEEGEGNGMSGTELVYLEPTKAVQVSVTGLNIFGDVSKIAEEIGAGSSEAGSSQANPEFGSSGDAPTPPPAATPLPGSSGAVSWADIEPISDEHPFHQATAVFIDGRTAEGIDPIVDATNLTGMPRVITRRGWGADESMRGKPHYNDKVLGCTVHHTAGSNNYTEAQAAGIVRGIYHYHAVTRGWGDVGYNALVDKYGNIYEGRAGGLDKPVQGAHAGGFNTNTWGISIMGNYTSVNPTEASIKSVANMLGWRMAVAGANPTGDIKLTSSGSSSKFGRGTTVELPAVFAHRDVGTTTCPGDAGYSQMERIRLLTKRKYDEVKGGVIVNDAPEGAPDLEIGDQPVDIGSLPLPGSLPLETDSEGNVVLDEDKARQLIEDLAEGEGSGTPAAGGDAATDGESGTAGQGADAPSAPEGGTAVRQTSNATPMSGGHVHAGNRSILAAALGVLGSPSIGGSAEDVVGVISPVRDADASVSAIAAAPGRVLGRDDANEFAGAWRRIADEHGDVLGDARTPVQVGANVPGPDGVARPVRYVGFEDGVITVTGDGVVGAVWGAVAQEWADQGFEIGRLGVPVSVQSKDGRGWRAEFRGGEVVADARGNAESRVR